MTTDLNFKEIKDKVRQNFIDQGHDIMPLDNITDGEIRLCCKTCHETATLYIPYHFKPLINSRVIGSDYVLNGRLINIPCNESKTQPQGENHET